MADEKDLLVAKATPVEEPDTGGKWKSGIFDCCKYGCCHKALLTAWCCAPIMLAQLLTRTKLTFLGVPGDYTNTFRNVLIIGISVYIINSIFQCTPDYPDFNEDGSFKMDGDEIVMVPGDCIDWQVNLTNFLNFAYWLYTLICLVRLRKVVRGKYEIPDECCGKEDVVCACCCPCLTAVQIAHQTADYDSEPAYFFSKTGLSETTEAIVV
mmetsp:Transcript_19578/g.48751  ORF Transcript_19578/g.48751 Transcript_19578/m.48751 type:complete len:210 (-) Transcript_19578:195-824(-)|eukprot:CAMPEP_0116098928 /NCGR_PEP_ID=MMETSP0327-20121206/11495_1 /TAXON_ID=44447 /ORGANISM="Pseudo-nitzschia delicatissima, Strain B596" /LENGTH=209 /DNA_ID=CAMNT_0003590769 /DNA_START=84 /DNA_END=713 /DNA_ORIENTATION=+